MKKNMGTADRVIRLIIAIGIWVLYAMGRIEGLFGVILGIIGGIFLATSLLGFCPLYVPFNFSTKMD
ncbi:MAG: DUF2892 domain-containing protein [Actinomycetota bacterium]|nr:DUF2892 domain-containing protein [Actinomycetota bacterium]